jgi:hypothetical protein
MTLAPHLKMAVTLILGLIGWGFCGLVMGIGPQLWGMDTTLVVHAVAAPMFFIVLSASYHTWLGYYRPLVTACLWVGLVVFLDVFLVALVIEGSFAMFQSFLGTWLVFILIFLATWLGGLAAWSSSQRG